MCRQGKPSAPSQRWYPRSVPGPQVNTLMSRGSVGRFPFGRPSGSVGSWSRRSGPHPPEGMMTRPILAGRSPLGMQRTLWKHCPGQNGQLGITATRGLRHRLIRARLAGCLVRGSCRTRVVACFDIIATSLASQGLVGRHGAWNLVLGTLPVA